MYIFKNEVFRAYKEFEYISLLIPRPPLPSISSVNSSHHNMYQTFCWNMFHLFFLYLGYLTFTSSKIVIFKLARVCPGVLKWAPVDIWVILLLTYPVVCQPVLQGPARLVDVTVIFAMFFGTSNHVDYAMTWYMTTFCYIFICDFYQNSHFSLL